MNQKFLLSVAFFSLLIYGCGTQKSALDTTSKGNGQIPSNFSASQKILLIEQSVDNDNSSVSVSSYRSVSTSTYTNAYMNKKNNAMKEYADQNYLKKHEFASQSEIYGSDSKYADKNKYQYAMVTSLVKPKQYTTMSSSGSMGSTHYQPIFKYYIYDRLNDKTYEALGHGSSIIMMAYKSAIKRLNEEK